MTTPQTTAGTAGEGYRSPAPHVCVTGPYEFGRRPCCTPVPAPRRTNEGAAKWSDDAREKLAAEVAKHKVGAFAGTETACWCDRRFRPNPEYRQHLTDALLPVVHEIAAEELREAADRVILAETFSEAAQLCRNRADALRPGPPS